MGNRKDDAEKAADKFVEDRNWGIYKDGEKFKKYVKADLIRLLISFSPKPKTEDKLLLMAQSHGFGITGSKDIVQWLDDMISELNRALTAWKQAFPFTPSPSVAADALRICDEKLSKNPHPPTREQAEEKARKKAKEIRENLRRMAFGDDWLEYAITQAILSASGGNGR